MVQSIEKLDLKGKRVFIRVDFNVPVADGLVADDTRIKGAMTTIKYAVDNGAKVVLASHFGRPKGERNPKYSLRPVADHINTMFMKVQFLSDCIGNDVETAINSMKNGEVVLLENLRFHSGEEKNDSSFVSELAKLCDVYINDAFGACHRKHASTYGLATAKDQKGAGFLVLKESKYFDQLLKNPDTPFAAIIGGAKVSDKLGVIEALLGRADKVFIGGGMAYTFLKQMGHNVGQSLMELDKVDTCRMLLEKAESRGVKIILPVDFVGSKEFRGAPVAIDSREISDDLMGLDIGAKSVELFRKELEGCKTVLWNGPMGVFEDENFANGTFAIANTLAEMDATVVIGGGDSVSAINQAGVADKVSHISTGGGASLEYIEFGTLPGIDVLRA